LNCIFYVFFVPAGIAKPFNDLNVPDIMNTLIISSKINVLRVKQNQVIQIYYHDRYDNLILIWIKWK
jgi:hypothetical protein